MGVHSLYSDDMQRKADAYISEHEGHGDVVPTASGLASHLGVTRSTIYKWRADYPTFSDTLERLQAKQERLLISNGLKGDFQPTIAKLMLANHGYSEKSEHQVTGAGGGPIEQSIQIVWGADDDS